MAQMRAAVSSTCHSLLLSGTPPLLPISLPVPSTSRRAEIHEDDTPPQKRLLLTAPRPGYPMETRFRDTKRRMMTALEMVNMRVSYQIRKALARSEAYSMTLETRVAVLETQARRHEWQRQTVDDFAVQHIMRTQALEAGARIDTLEDTGIVFSCNFKKMAPKRTTRSTQVPPALTATTTTVTEAQLQALINQGVAAAMAKEKASRVRNGYGSNGSGPRLAQAVRECTYLDFLKCQPLSFKGTGGVVGLTQWVEKYIDGLPDTIHDSVKANKPKTIQGTIEFATELMDRKICTFAERQTENKRKLDDNNNQAQQKPLKKSLAATNNHRNPTCYQCGNQGHYRSDCPELKNQDHVNQARGTRARGMVHALEGGETN
nr:hypothetical protein [Tanacetum cinerariifolium]